MGVWVKDLKAEHGMRQLGIKFTVEKGILIADIDQELSHERQARIDKKLDESRALKVGEHWQNGGALPMPILQRIGHGKRLFIWSGNHRIAGVDFTSDREIDAYLVEVHDLRMEDLLPRVVNTWEGKREDSEAELTHAIYMVEKHAMDVAEIAKQFQIKYGTLVAALSASCVANDLKELGIKDNLPRTARVKLAPLAGNKNVLGATVRLLTANKVSVTGDKGMQILDDVKKGRTEAQQMAEIGKWEKIFEQVKKVEKGASVAPKIKAGNRTRFINKLADLRKMLEKINLATQLQLDDESAQIAAGHWSVISVKMTKLMNGEGGSK